MALFTAPYRCTQVSYLPSFVDGKLVDSYAVSLAQETLPQQEDDLFVGDSSYLVIRVADPTKFLVGQYYEVKVGSD